MGIIIGGLLALVGLTFFIVGVLGLVRPKTLQNPKQPEKSTKELRRVGAFGLVAGLVMLGVGGALLPGDQPGGDTPPADATPKVEPPPPAVTASTPSGTPSAAEEEKETTANAAAEAKIERLIASPAPPPAGPAPVSGMCAGEDEGYCLGMKISMLEDNWPAAWKGDYQAQRNVAYCLGDGCYGSTPVNRLQACAWRAVILESAHAEADDTDIRNLELDCGRLSEAGRLGAQERANAIREQISRR